LRRLRTDYDNIARANARSTRKKSNNILTIQLPGANWTVLSVWQELIMESDAETLMQKDLPEKSIIKKVVFGDNNYQ
jgi:hypothetical protein